MARLGEFGAAKRDADPDRERDTFVLCGVEFNMAEGIDPLALLEFGEAAASGLGDDDPAGLAAVNALIRSSVDEADWPRFRATVRKHRPKMEALLELCKVVVQRESGRPTGKPSDSSGGLSLTTGNSKELSSSVESSNLWTWDERFRDMKPVAEAAAELSLAG